MSFAEQRLTPAEYLEIERAAETKSEFFEGRMFAMAGANEDHNLITINVAGILTSRLQDQPCRIYSHDMRVKVSPSGLYTYPDVVVVCGARDFEDDRRDTLLNPTLIVEVLSPSTEAYDRGEKFAHYRRLGSLQEYVLISQDRRRVERFARQAASQEWLLAEVSEAAAEVPLASIGCALNMAEIYARVEFPSTRLLHPPGGPGP